jgi:hypothetical protein
MSFLYDSTGVNPDEYPTLPEGWYPFRIYEAEEQTSSKGNPMVLAKCEVLGDARYQGMTIWHYVTFIPKGRPGDGINVHFRKSIGVPFGGNDQVDAKDWIGRKFMGYAVQETYEGKTRNKLTKISPIKDDESVTEVGATSPDDLEVPF